MIYHIWITALLAVYESKIVQKLVAKGYVISSAATDKITMTTENGASAIIGLRVSSGKTCQQIYDDVVEILTSIDAKFYSVIISEFSQNSMWAGSNIILSKIEKENKPLDKKFN